MHVLIDVDTLMVLGAKVTASNVADISIYEELVRKTHRDFKFQYISADKGYSSRKAHEIAAEL